MVHGESCYYVANTSSASTWNKSRTFCQNLGADLTVIKSEDENQFVSDLLRNTSGDSHGWIGLYRKADSKFYWLDDRPEEGNYQNWKGGEPNNNQSNEDCVVLIIKLKERKSYRKWNDRKCTERSHVAICQWPI